MSRSSDEVQLVVLDACCVINLWASGRPAEILTVLPYRFGVARYVADEEVLTLRSDQESLGPGGVPRAIELSSEQIELEVLEMSEDLESDFVRFAAALDDGEAWTCAHAVARKAWVATDDRKALRILRHEEPPVRTIETPELLREWAARTEPSGPEVREVLRAIEFRAWFRPRRSSVLRSWWLKASK